MFYGKQMKARKRELYQLMIQYLKYAMEALVEVVKRMQVSSIFSKVLLILVSLVLLFVGTILTFVNGLIELGKSILTQNSQENQQ
jgi:hypothetical protein